MDTRFFYWVIIYILFVPFTCLSQISQKELNKIHKIQDLFTQHHVDPYEDNNPPKELIGKLFVNQIDPLNLLFTNDEYEHLIKLHCDAVSFENLDSMNTFLTSFREVSKKAISRSEEILEAINSTRLKINYRDTVSLKDLFTNQIPADEKELHEKWRILLKLRYLSLKGASEVDTEISAIFKDSFLCWLREKEGIISSNHLLFSQYLKAFANGYDPHSLYFSYEEATNFIRSLSKSTFSYGFKLDRNDFGRYIVTSLIPGGAAWKSGKINNGDEIWQIKDETGTIHQLSCWNQETMNIFLDNPAINEITVYVRHKDQTSSNLVLRKENTENVDNLTNIYLLDGDSKIGYLALPSFYSSDDFDNVKGCTNDVAAELLKIRDQNIDGLILDLRNNGGGSLQEAIGLAGLFLDVGPIGITKTQTGKAETLKDFNRGAAYTGPLVVLVNENSASASELLTSTLQDHNRAVIVGTSTLGKATGQEIFALNPKDDDMGFLKITTMKIYRVRGNSYQLNGVQPDIPLRKKRTFSFSESDYLNALQPDHIIKKVYFTPGEELPLDTLKKKFSSETRNLKNDRGSSGFFILNEDVFKNSDEEKADYSNDLFTVKDNAFNKDIVEALEFRDEFNSEIKMTIESDSEIIETYQIICELIEQLHP